MTNSIAFVPLLSSTRTVLELLSAVVSIGLYPIGWTRLPFVFAGKINYANSLGQ